VCQLLSEAEVTDLTGRRIVQIDRDGASSGDASRYCRWQLSAGQLAVFLSRTTKAEFEVKNAAGEAVPGVGQDGYLLAGHLFVLDGTVMVDVYARGADDPQNLEVAKQTAAVLRPKI
jgi:hypothetical protein